MQHTAKNSLTIKKPNKSISKHGFTNSRIKVSDDI